MRSKTAYDHPHVLTCNKNNEHYLEIYKKKNERQILLSFIKLDMLSIQDVSDKRNPLSFEIIQEMIEFETI